MLLKVRRWNSKNQISSCLLPALTSITSFCHAGAASTKWRGLEPPSPSHGAARDGEQRRKGKVRKTFTRQEWAMQTWCLGGFLPAKGVLVAAPPRAGLGGCAGGTAKRGCRCWEKVGGSPIPELFPSLLFVEVWNILQRLFTVTTSNKIDRGLIKFPCG